MLREKKVGFGLILSSTELMLPCKQGQGKKWHKNLKDQVGGMKASEFIKETVISFIFVIAGWKLCIYFVGEVVYKECLFPGNRDSSSNK